jgi:LmbE family N-acetylglucosaminyl deacetylase
MTTRNSEENEKPFSRAMVVVAHPDDAEFGCSGTVAKWCRLGWDVVYVMCTDGSKGSEDRETTSAKLAELRATEQRAAGKILGLKDVVFLGNPDGYLEPTLELRRDISREIRRWKPDVLITTNPVRDLSGSGYVGHPDHMAAGEAALAAVYPAARDHLTFPELLAEGHEPHKVREVWLMLGGQHVDLYNPLEKCDVETAIKALLAHESQIKNPESATERMWQWRTDAGRNAGAEYAERFKVFRLS